MPPQSTPTFEMIPEFKEVGEVMNDVALRTQQTLIALQIYQDKLTRLNIDLPGLQIDGYELTEIPLSWNLSKDPEKLLSNLRRSVTFSILGALDFQLYLLDGYMVQLAKHYYGIPVQDGELWMTEEIFQLAAGFDLGKIEHYVAIIELRRVCNQLRRCQQTSTITIPEYFELYQNIWLFVCALSAKVSYDAAEKKNKLDKLNGSEGI